MPASTPKDDHAGASSPVPEEGLNDVAALGLEHAGDDLDAVVEAGNVERAARDHAAGLRFARAENEPATRACTIAPTHIRQGSSVTYSTASVEAVVAQRRAAGAQRLISACAVGSQGRSGVGAAADDPTPAQHRADGHLARGRPRRACSSARRMKLSQSATAVIASA